MPTHPPPRTCAIRCSARTSAFWMTTACKLPCATTDRKSTRLNSSHQIISYAVFCLKTEKHTSELQSPDHLVCRLLLKKEDHTSEFHSQDHFLYRRVLENRITTATQLVADVSCNPKY